jgi:uncharacterized spore protein YtfJ
MTAIDGAREAGRQAGRGAASDAFLERLAELVGAKAGVEAVFGGPIRQGDLTIVPVARVRWGFGGGGGQADEAPAGPAWGSGGGGGVIADPVGYLEVRPGGAEFKRIGGPSPVLILTTALGVAIVLRAVATVTGR